MFIYVVVDFREVSAGRAIFVFILDTHLAGCERYASKQVLSDK